MILESAEIPYQGYVDTRGQVGLPDLPALGEVVGLLSGSSRIRVWYASPQAWRVAELANTGERDLYQTAQGTFLWDFERDQVTHIVGETSVRLPRAADLLPPDLARMLLGRAGSEDVVTAIPGRRVAGVVAAGIRLSPADDATTIGHVDVWADPATGLPVQVEVVARGSGTPTFTSRFLDLNQETPGTDVLAPTWPPSAGLTIATNEDVMAALTSVTAAPLPPRLAGRARAAGADDVGVGVYGAGLSTFAVLALPGRFGFRSIQVARESGGVPVALPGAEAYEIRTPLVTGLVVRWGADRRTRRTFLLAGPVTPEPLRQAAAELLASAREPE
jgi:hypothetical protein